MLRKIGHWANIVFFTALWTGAGLCTYDLALNDAEGFKTIGLISKIQCPMCGHEFYERR